MKNATLYTSFCLILKGYFTVYKPQYFSCLCEIQEKTLDLEEMDFAS